MRLRSNFSAGSCKFLISPLRPITSVASLGKGRPALLLDFLDQRMTLGHAGEIPGLVPIPYELHETTEALKQVPLPLLVLARQWFDAAGQSLDFGVERVISAVFGDFPPLLRTTLEALLKSGQRSDALFALEILGAFEDQPPVFELAREAVALWGGDQEVKLRIQSAIARQGGTEGFFGRVKALHAKRARLEEWRTDLRAGVTSFADDFIASLDQDIADETRRTQAVMASRRLDYGEDPLVDAKAHEPPDPDTA